MRVRSLIMGMVAWTLAVAVPAAYSACIAHAAVKEEGRSYAINELMKNFNSMPFIMWLYVFAMGFLGLMMLGHGMTKPRLEEELSL